ncbi:hypothetical protein GLAREA_00123 [Glarea lozoyensis ATCC 20868]|uniref:Uncharacterized protein n=1 Tax=Glarea lozoyensis (strain ATCC 20868 / MF5171) TaxID=1116229 RepID=S3CTH8_GLAL2|nr:uncharacterized protein GLAREA_00123 [Glarea lozoyensis ATCC 20868]EPE28965.1 hypothetical protein GLAREA_00123 [Glarea lozoyensis ATCC 20868]
MTLPALPKRSFAHRVACKALYRALLVQTQHIPLKPEVLTRGPVNPITHLVRKRFKQNIALNSKKQVVKCLEVGYAVERLLRSSASGSKAATDQVNNILQILHDDAYQQSLVTERPHRVRPPKPIAKPGAPKLLDVVPRPLSEIKGGIRSVPKMVFTSRHRTSFLRYSKPQSPYLSRVIRQKDDTRVKRFETAERLFFESEEGKLENVWNHNLSAELGVKYDMGWDSVPATVRRRVIGRDLRDVEDARELAGRMMDVAEREMELAEQERKVRRHEKLERKWALKKERWEREGREVHDVVKEPFVAPEVFKPYGGGAGSGGGEERNGLEVEEGSDLLAEGGKLRKFYKQD